jgi:hypothetical protein
MAAKIDETESVDISRPPFLSKLVAGLVTCRLLPVVSHPQYGYQFKVGKIITGI